MKSTEKQLAAARNYRKNNPEKVKAASSNWRKNNMDRFLETEKRWRFNNIERSLFTEAKGRSKKRNVEFTIKLEDIPPKGTHCPLLGHPFADPNTGSPFSPSLDRIDPRRGYVPGNVWIVGRRANMIKNDGTAEEHEKIARAMRAAEASTL